MSKRILVVGGGLAGTIFANGLCRHLGHELKTSKVQITMLGTSERHLYQPALLFVPFGLAGEEDLFRDQRKLLNRHITYHIDPAKHINAEHKKVTTESGRVIEYDILVLATGFQDHAAKHSRAWEEGALWFYGSGWCTAKCVRPCKPLKG